MSTALHLRTYQFRLYCPAPHTHSYNSCPTEHYPYIDSITALPCCMIHLKAITISMTFVAFDL